MTAEHTSQVHEDSRDKPDSPFDMLPLLDVIEGNELRNTILFYHPGNPYFQHWVRRFHPGAEGYIKARARGAPPLSVVSERGPVDPFVLLFNEYWQAFDTQQCIISTAQRAAVPPANNQTR